MSLHITCNRCDKSLDEPGALVFSPPRNPGAIDTDVCKYHICVECWETLRLFVDCGVEPETKWWCRRCQSTVDMEAFRCNCATSPSPWEPVDDILHGGQS